MKKCKVSFLQKIHARVHCCHEAAIVKVSGGQNRILWQQGNSKSGDCRELYFDNDLLAYGTPSGCPTCNRLLEHGYGRSVMSAVECQRVSSALNGRYEGLESAARNLAPILGLFETGYYILMDSDQYPSVSDGSGYDDFICQTVPSINSFDAGIRFMGGWPVVSFHNSPLFLWASQSPLAMKWDRVKHYMSLFETDRADLPRPIAVYMNGGMSLVLDGHHKVAAAAMVGRPIRTIIILKIESPNPVMQTLRQGGKVFLNAAGSSTYIGRDMATGEERLFYGIGGWSPKIVDENGNVLSDIFCWGSDAVPPYREIVPEHEVDWRDWGGLDCEFTRHYKPNHVNLPDMSLIERGTHVELCHIRESFMTLRKAEDRHPSLEGDWSMIGDLIAYKQLFPKSKWITDDEVNWMCQIGTLCEFGLTRFSTRFCPDGTFVIEGKPCRHGRA